MAFSASDAQGRATEQLAGKPRRGFVTRRPGKRLFCHDDASEPQCSICRAGRRGEVDLLAVEKHLAQRAGSINTIARKYKLSPDALGRHWRAIGTARRNYLKSGADLTATALAAAAEERLQTIDHLRIARAALHRGLQAAILLNDFRGIASLADALCRNASRGAEMSGEWLAAAPKIENTVNVMLPATVADILANLTKILAPFPEARAAVINYLRGRDQPDGSFPLIEHADDS